MCFSNDIDNCVHKMIQIEENLIATVPLMESG